jgi:hypothetical protein
MLNIKKTVYRIFKKTSTQQIRSCKTTTCRDCQHGYFLFRLVARIYDSYGVLRSAYKLKYIVSNTFCKHM